PLLTAAVVWRPAAVIRCMMAMKLLSARRFCGFESPGRNIRDVGTRDLVSVSVSSGNLQMTLCNKCGAGIAPNESFCGRCGAELPHENTPAPGNAGSAGDAKSAAASNEANL